MAISQPGNFNQAWIVVEEAVTKEIIDALEQLISNVRR